MSTSTASPSGRVRLPVKDPRVQVPSIPSLQGGSPLLPAFRGAPGRPAAPVSALERQHMLEG